MLARAPPDAGGRPHEILRDRARRHQTAPGDVTGKGWCLGAEQRLANRGVNAVRANQQVTAMTRTASLDVDAGVAGFDPLDPRAREQLDARLRPHRPFQDTQQIGAMDVIVGINELFPERIVNGAGNQQPPAAPIAHLHGLRQEADGLERFFEPQMVQDPRGVG